MTPPINAAEIERLAELVKDASPHGTYSSRAATHFVISVPILIAALREMKGALEKIEANALWPEITKPCANQTLRAIAEKVEGL